MRPLLLLLGVWALAACGPNEDDGITVQGVDPTDANGDLAPDSSLRSGVPGLAPDADIAPEVEQAPEQTLGPDSLQVPSEADS